VAMAVAVATWGGRLAAAWTTRSRSEAVMSENDQSSGPVSEADWAQYMETANALLAPANVLVQTESAERTAAAFLYACARYNAFAMQSQSDDPSVINREFTDFLVERFEIEMREHMGEDLGARGAKGHGDGRAALAALAHEVKPGNLNASGFFDMGDRFINKANDLTRTVPISRISAAFMHACTRFAVFSMQSNGLKASQVDDPLVRDFKDAYAQLLDAHLQETLIESKA